MTQRKRVGRRRWADLVRFLTKTMQSSGSERVRMQAAQMLANILTLREQKEIAELRAAARNNILIETPTESQADTPAPTDQAEDLRIRDLIARITAKATGQVKGKDSAAA